MERLPDECLCNIFSFLGTSDKIRCEVVCQRWQRLLLHSYKSMVHLNVAEFMESTYSTYFQQDNLSFEPTVVGLLSHFGDHVASLSMGAKWFKLSEEIVNAIAQCCTTLLYLDLSCSIVSTSLINLVNQLSHQLISLDLNDTHWTKSEYMDELLLSLSSLERLHSLNLRCVRSTAFDWLPTLPASLQHLNLNGVSKLEPDELSAFLLWHTGLKSLRLAGFQRINQNTLDLIGETETLTCLELSHVYRDDLDMSVLANLKNLEELYLQLNNSVKCDAMSTLCESLESVRILNVTGCRLFRDFSHLMHCHNLEDLTVGQTLHLVDSDLEAIAMIGKLSRLIVTKVNSITDRGIISVIDLCPLRELSVSFCSNVSDKSFSLSLQHSLTSNCFAGCGLSDVSLLEAGRLSTPRTPDLDVSHCRNLTDHGVLALHHQLLQRSRNEKIKPLTLYVQLTRINKNVAEQVRDLVILLF